MSYHPCYVVAIKPHFLPRVLVLTSRLGLQPRAHTVCAQVLPVPPALPQSLPLSFKIPFTPSAVSP